MRLFVALELTEAVRAALRALVARLEPAGADLRWVRPDGMHLTLKFIGELPEAKLPLLRKALARVRSARPVALEFRGLGYFPNERRPRVFWVGVEASDNLPVLAADVEAALEPLGVPRESRPFAPHLTLGRFKSPNRLERLQQEIARLPATEFGRVETAEFALFQSRLSPRGAEYTRLESFPVTR
jgi:2'-5' RNA ligase